jgi:hypothetical protein
MITLVASSLSRARLIRLLSEQCRILSNSPGCSSSSLGWPAFGRSVLRVLLPDWRGAATGGLNGSLINAAVVKA